MRLRMRWVVVSFGLGEREGDGLGRAGGEEGGGAYCGR